jgi:hypothetical protein
VGYNDEDSEPLLLVHGPARGWQPIRRPLQDARVPDESHVPSQEHTRLGVITPACCCEFSEIGGAVFAVLDSVVPLGGFVVRVWTFRPGGCTSPMYQWRRRFALSSPPTLPFTRIHQHWCGRWRRADKPYPLRIRRGTRSRCGSR